MQSRLPCISYLLLPNLFRKQDYPFGGIYKDVAILGDLMYIDYLFTYHFH